MQKKKTNITNDKTRILPRQVFIAIGLACIVAGSIYVLTSFATKVFYEAPRAARVREIYASLQLPSDYVYQNGAIAGEKRLYKHDGTRSWSSYQRYIHGASLTDTVAELERQITAAGFTQIYSSDKAAVITERRYQNDRGEYLRFKAESKLRLEYYQNAHMMGTDSKLIEANAVDPDTGPIQVIIKVNLDDDNE